MFGVCLEKPAEGQYVGAIKDVSVYSNSFKFISGKSTPIFQNIKTGDSLWLSVDSDLGKVF